MEIYRAHVLVCGGTGCSSSGSATLIERFNEKIAENGLEKEVKVIRTGCFGLCEAGPVVIVYLDAAVINGLDAGSDCVLDEEIHLLVVFG